MEDDQNIDNIANNIVQQLKQTTAYSNSVVESKNIDNREELEKYIIKKSSTLIDQSMEVISNLKDYIQAGADPDEISAFAEVVKASSGALEALNKIYIQHEKAKSSTSIKQMEIDAKLSIASQDNTTKLLVGREELIKQMIDESKKVVDI